ncbi:MAG: septum formation initiator family protein [Holosporales bacterium]|jgi:cell division protein FtsB|nr:septum formation initiator family protein [Holosporales bacterium]
MRQRNKYVGATGRLQKAAVAAIVTAGLAYFTVHALSGKNGLISYVRLKKKYDSEVVELAERAAELEGLKRRTKMLSSGRVDLDLLEERCRIVLGYVDEQDVVIKEKALRS